MAGKELDISGNGEGFENSHKALFEKFKIPASFPLPSSFSLKREGIFSFSARKKEPEFERRDRLLDKGVQGKGEKLEDKTFKKGTENVIWKKPESRVEREKQEEEGKFFLELENLDLPLRDLEKKKVFDVGCGDGVVPKLLRGKGITPWAFGGDLEGEIDEYGLKNKEGFFVYDYGKDEPPVKNLDFVIAHSSLHPEASEENLKNVNSAIQKLLGGIKNTGEIRIWPAYPQDRWKYVLDDLYKDLPRTNKFEYEFKQNERGKRKKEKSFGDQYDDTYLVLRKKLISNKVARLP